MYITDVTELVEKEHQEATVRCERIRNRDKDKHTERKKKKTSLASEKDRK